MVNAIPTDAGHPATMEDPKDRLLREMAQELNDERERRTFDLKAIERLTRENIALKKELDAERKRADGCSGITQPGPYSGDSTR